MVKIYKLIMLLLVLFFASFSFSHGEPLNAITARPDFMIEVTEAPNAENLHTLNYNGSKKMEIPEAELVKLRDEKFARQLIIGNFSTENGKVKVININKFEILDNKILVPSKHKGSTYLLERETMLRLLNEEIIINWSNWTSILDRRPRNQEQNHDNIPGK